MVVCGEAKAGGTAEAVWKCLCNDYVKLLANAVLVVF